jgi:23S rRNA (guanine745-N1)-methyltransferase
VTGGAMIDDALDLLACPHCAGALSRRGGSVTCMNRHTFDVARSGYLSLLPGDANLGSADTAEMVAAREAFLGAGHFEPLAEALADEAERALGGRAERRVGGRAARAPGDRAERPLGTAAERPGLLPGCIIDLGAGTGSYLARLLDRLPGRIGLALDLSKHALRRAARAHPRIAAVACDAWRPLPVRDSVAGLVLSVFAPRNGPEIARVLRPGGALLVVTPTERHLAELVEQLGLSPSTSASTSASPPRSTPTSTSSAATTTSGPSSSHPATRPTPSPWAPARATPRARRPAPRGPPSRRPSRSRPIVRHPGRSIT